MNFINKIFHTFHIFLAILIPLFCFNLILSRDSYDNVFPFVFSVMGLLNVYLGIKLLNLDKKILSVITFSISIFLFALVGLKICLYS